MTHELFYILIGVAGHMIYRALRDRPSNRDGNSGRMTHWKTNPRIVSIGEDE